MKTEVSISSSEDKSDDGGSDNDKKDLLGNLWFLAKKQSQDIILSFGE